MASAVQSMRLSLRVASRRAVGPAASVSPRRFLTIRPFSSTPLQRRSNADTDDLDGLEDDDGYDMDKEIDRADLDRALRALRDDPDYESARRLQERVVNKMGSIFTEAMRTRKPRSEDFWTADEFDNDLMIDEGNTEKFEEDDILAMGHGKLEEYREYREYARVAAWQMPLLSKLVTPFEPPSDNEPLRFRYTSYMGESHPAEKKVVVEFCPEDLPLDEAQQEKLKKLLGARWNPQTEIAKMSCEQFEHQAQNKRYLGDLVHKLIEKAKDPTDMFEDIPLDTRHHTWKTKPTFPVEWRMTDERRKYLAETRQKQQLIDQERIQEGTLIDGVEKVSEVNQTPEMATLRFTQTLQPKPSGGPIPVPSWRQPKPPVTNA